MALIKALDTNYGVQANYWIIGAVLENFYLKKYEVQLIGFASREVKEAGAQPLAELKFDITSGYQVGLTRFDIYQLLKQSEIFVDAESDDGE